MTTKINSQELEGRDIFLGLNRTITIKEVNPALKGGSGCLFIRAVDDINRHIFIFCHEDLLSFDRNDFLGDVSVKLTSAER